MSLKHRLHERGREREENYGRALTAAQLILPPTAPIDSIADSLGKAKFSDLLIPWATFTEPEVAHVGLYPRDMEANKIAFDTFTKEVGVNMSASLIAIGARRSSHYTCKQHFGSFVRDLQ